MSLDDLKSQRALIAGKLADVMEAQARLREAATAETSALQAIGELGRREAAMMSEWARAGAKGPAPQIDMEARQGLAEALGQASAQAEAASGAAIDLDAEQRRLTHNLQSTNAAIEDLALDKLVERQGLELANIAELIRTMITPRLARACALHAMLIEQGQRHQSSGRTDAARRMFQRAEGVPRMAIDLADPTLGDVIAKVPVWLKRFSDLTGDEPVVAEPVDLEERRREVEASMRPIEPFVPPVPEFLPRNRA